MSRESSAQSARNDATLAPYWHTVALVSLIVAVAITGTLFARHGAASAPADARSFGPYARISTQYLPLLLVNWGLTAYVCRLFRARNVLLDLLGRRWNNVGRALTDLALALLVLASIEALEALAVHAFGAGRNAAVSALLPGTVTERLTWLLVAVSVGFCEEVVYRGYLQVQLGAFTGRASWGVLLQALLFGLAHAEQGTASALRIALYGLILGALAHWRRSLLPGIVCHVAIDLAGALFR